ncbi:MAG TPA: glycosyltransferase family 2 protein [Blastocatellia bacterium]|nr:glycosyltransferase family 2 protein [Blastocatellia bacterium]
MTDFEPVTGPRLSIVVPVYKSEACLDALVAAVSEALAPAGAGWEIILVNDGSPDRSWDVIQMLCERYRNVIGVDLRRNFGQDNAILTGVRIARGKYIAIMDDDLQHDPRYLPTMLDKIEEGWDVVYADFRVKRQKRWKNLGSWFNGKVAEWVIDKPGNIYLSPYKIISGEVADLICNYDGPDPYVDGLLFQVTSRISNVPAEHQARFAGKSTYTFWKSLRVWARLAFSFSVKPLRIVSLCGFGFAALGLILTAVVVVYRLRYPEEFSAVAVGWASLMVAVLVIGGAQMIFFGVLGEYAGRSYMKVNNKPQTAIREVLNSTAGKQRSRRSATEVSREVRVGNQPDL